MNNGRECAQYFKQLREWNRCFELMRKKWESLGRTGGKIVLKDSTQAERQAIGKVMGKVYWEERVEFFMADFEEKLQSTRFAPVTLHVLLEEYFECAIKSNQDKKTEKKKQIEKFFKSCKAYFQEQTGTESQRIVDWLSFMEEKQENGYVLLLRELQSGEVSAEKIVCAVGNALIKSLHNTEDVPIAVLAAGVSGNPHYLDRGCVAGNLLMQGICFLQDIDWPQSSMEWKGRLLAVHILPDDISSMVTVLGVHLQTGNGIHPAVEAFYGMKEAVVLTALNLRGATAAWADEKRVYVVENEMVFTYLADKLKDRNTALLCTSGQLRNAALELLQLFVEKGTEIYYSGDMDPEGMGIADRLWLKYPENEHIWRMSCADYHRAISDEVIDNRSLSMLNNLKNPELRDTAKYVLKKKRAAYQENILGELLMDIRK